MTGMVMAAMMGVAIMRWRKFMRTTMRKRRNWQWLMNCLRARATGLELEENWQVQRGRGELRRGWGCREIPYLREAHYY